MADIVRPAGGYYPPVGFYFKVQFIGLEAKDNDARFQEVTGLNSELTVEELKEGGENRFTHKLPNPAKFPNLVLKRGMLEDSALIKWFHDAIYNFEFKPIQINVALLDESGDALTTWKFARAWPMKWTVSDLKAMDNSLVVETVELAYQYFTRE
jgi:phage tail-like protein